jgi:hypothetical protein
MGARIFAAAIKALVLTEGLGAAAANAANAGSPPPRLIIAGCSAGSRGAMMNLDYVPGMLEDLGVAPGTIHVVGFFDSPLWVDVQPIDPTIVSLQAQTQAIVQVINATARMGDACSALYTDPSDSWKCYFGEYRMPTLVTPFLMSASQDDRFQLSWNIGGNSTAGYTPAIWHPSQRAYADAFVVSMSSVIAGLPTAEQANSGSMVFSTACFHHCVTQSAAFWNVAISLGTLEPGSGFTSTTGLPVSLRDALKMWLWPQPGQTTPTRLVQQCTGFRCGRCTTKIALAIKGGYQLPSPPAPGAATLFAPFLSTSKSSAGRKTSSHLIFVLLLLAVTGAVLSWFARDATRRMRLAAPLFAKPRDEASQPLLMKPSASLQMGQL